MDRQTPHAASLLVALIASALWVVVLLLAPAGGAIIWLAALSAALIALAWALRAPLAKAPGLVALGAGVAVGIATLALTHLVGPWVLDAVPIWRAEFVGMYVVEVAAAARPVLFDVALTLVVIAGEEVLWRGLALSALRARMPEAAAVILSAVLYAVCQLGFEKTLPAAAALALGLAWGWLRVVTWPSGRLIAPLVAHAIWTLGILWVWPLRLQP